jgi:hypothetical protein
LGVPSIGSYAKASFSRAFHCNSAAKPTAQCFSGVSIAIPHAKFGFSGNSIPIVFMAIVLTVL